MIKTQTNKEADIKSDFPIFKNNDIIYLDSAASAQKPNLVINSINDVYSNYYANINRGVYTLSQIATDKYEDAREVVKEFINAESSKEIIFVNDRSSDATGMKN